VGTEENMEEPIAA